MRGLVCIALLALAGACEAPSDKSDPAAEMPDRDGNAFRADAPADRAYAGEWARNSDGCNNQREVWTIEENRMGMKRERFCVFERIFISGDDPEQGWSASARCLADGKQSHDFVFFRVNPNKQQMRVTINDTESVDLIRCPMRT
ncbi:MAG: hypothetical protein ABMA14_06765 [Hyphomonadaceae bacterium]